MNYIPPQKQHMNPLKKHKSLSMNINKSYLAGTSLLAIFLLTLVLVTATAATTAQQESANKKSENVSSKLIKEQLNWSQLTYKANLLGLSIKSKIDLVSIPADETDALLMNPEPHTAVASSSKENYYMTLRTKLLGRDMRTMIWFDPADARALQRVRLETGARKSEYKAYRFTENGTFMIRKKPKDGEAERPHQNWTNINKEHTKLPQKIAKQLMLAEPASLFYIVSVADLSTRGDFIELPMLSRGNVVMVKLTVEDQKTYQANYTKKQPSEDNKIKHDVEALEISIRARDVDNPDETYDLKLAGLKGDLRFIIDQETHIPLELSGKMKVLGTVRFKLEEIVTR